jgi:hypothetical protein
MDCLDGTQQDSVSSKVGVALGFEKLVGLVDAL